MQEGGSGRPEDQPLSPTSSSAGPSGQQAPFIAHQVPQRFCTSNLCFSLALIRFVTEHAGALLHVPEKSTHLLLLLSHANSRLTARWCCAGDQARHLGWPGSALPCLGKHIRYILLLRYCMHGPVHAPLLEQPLPAPQVSDIKRANGLLSDSAMYAKDRLFIPTQAMPPMG